ncbi:sulfite exporter taue/safe family protein 2 [Quercus suber]|uniref:Sulfite exporter taue/safe family protein 2 n=1 Tax=Quercus suber TaxID=58331 RepID=A0AAW0JZP3_QUESU
MPCKTTSLTLTLYKTPDTVHLETQQERSRGIPKQMKIHKFTCFILPLILFITIGHSHAKQTQPISESLTIDHFLNKIYEYRNTQQTKFQETQPKLASPMVIAGVLCFIASSISSAGGIGGGGLFIPILTIVAGLDLKTASSFSAFMVTGGSIANVMCNLCTTRPKFGGKTLIDFDIALLSEPCMLLGVSIGVICNLVFPEWLITLLFATFLAWTTSKTCKNGLSHWKMESEELRRNRGEILENGSVEDGTSDGTKEPLLGMKEDGKSRLPWMKIGILVLVWFSFFVLYLLRGNRYGQGIIQIEPCGVLYWVISSLQIPLALIFTAWILCKKESNQHQTSNDKEEDLIRDGPSNKMIFPLMASLAGMLGGVFGIGGGMLISPLLLQVGITSMDPMQEGKQSTSDF